MTTATARSESGYRNAGGMVIALMLAAMVGGLSATQATADENNQGREDQHDRGYQEQRRPEQSYRHEAPRYYEAPRYVYAPPPVYYLSLIHI